MSVSTLRAEFAESPDGDGDWIVSISDSSEWGDYGMDDWTEDGLLPYFGPISGCPAKILDKPFNTGFGAPSRPMYVAWTTSYVITCTEYDGSTGSQWTDRNPVPL